jgi:hypothetical protein
MPPKSLFTAELQDGIAFDFHEKLQHFPAVFVVINDSYGRHGGASIQAI